VPPPPPPPPPAESEGSSNDLSAVSAAGAEEQAIPGDDGSQEGAKPEDGFKLKFCTVCASNNNR
jgi:RNA polymerase II subunit A C-terminal domain phosphatase SSU72